MKTRLCALAIVAATLVPAAAQAEEDNPFDGPHIAVLAGWDDFGYHNPDLNFDKSLSDVAYGFSAGWDFGFGPDWVIGIDSSLLFSDNKDSFTGVQVNPVADPATLTVKANHDWDIGLRVGYVLNQAAMVYVKGAYANTGLKAILTQNDIDTRVGEGEDGWRVGVGAEIMVFKPFFVTAEYRYTGYGHSLDRNQILGGIGAHF